MLNMISDVVLTMLVLIAIVGIINPKIIFMILPSRYKMMGVDSVYASVLTAVRWICLLVAIVGSLIIYGILTGKINI